MKTSIILSRGETGFMALQDKTRYYFSSIKDLAEMIAKLIQPSTSTPTITLTVEVPDAESTKEPKQIES